MNPAAGHLKRAGLIGPFRHNDLASDIAAGNLHIRTADVSRAGGLAAANGTGTQNRIPAADIQDHRTAAHITGAAANTGTRGNRFFMSYVIVFVIIYFSPDTLGDYCAAPNVDRGIAPPSLCRCHRRRWLRRSRSGHTRSRR